MASKDILRFFETGELSFDSKETLEVIRIRDAVIKAKANGDEQWVKVN